jgi:hypothetical protein
MISVRSTIEMQSLLVLLPLTRLLVSEKNRQEGSNADQNLQEVRVAPKGLVYHRITVESRKDHQILVFSQKYSQY